MKQGEAQIAVRAIQPIVAGLDALRLDTVRLIERAGLGGVDLTNPDTRVFHSSVARLWELAATEDADDCIGIHIAETAPIESFELHSYALLASRDLREAWTKGVRYQRLIHEATDLTFEQDGREASLRHSLPGGRNVARQPAEFLMAIWLRITRLIAGDLDPLTVRFAHDEPPDISEHERVFRGPIVFSSGATAFVIDSEHLDRPNPGADAALSRLTERYAASLLRNLTVSGRLSDRVRTWIANGLRGSAPTAAEAATEMNMSVRSLGRALQEEGTTYRELLETLRKETATSLLIEPDCSIGEVAFLLGFSELSAFTRAFKRWTGMNPSEFRQRHR